MGVLRIARALAAISLAGLGASLVVTGCSSFDADEEPGGADGGAADSGSFDAGATDGAVGVDAADGGPICSQATHRNCFDFSVDAPPNQGFDGKNAKNEVAFERDESTSVSPPASLRARIDPITNGLQSTARGVLHLGKIVTGTYRVEVSMRIACSGAGVPPAPTLLELFCSDTLGASILRVERPSASTIEVVASPQSGPEASRIVVPAPESTWTRFSFSLDARKTGHLTVRANGSETVKELASTVTCTDTSDVQLLLGPQDTGATAPCEVHYDDLTLDVTD